MNVGMETGIPEATPNVSLTPSCKLEDPGPFGLRRSPETHTASFVPPFSLERVTMAPALWADPLDPSPRAHRPLCAQCLALRCRGAVQPAGGRALKH